MIQLSTKPNQTFQDWQSEFLSVFLIVILTIYLEKRAHQSPGPSIVHIRIWESNASPQLRIFVSGAKPYRITRHRTGNMPDICVNYLKLSPKQPLATHLRKLTNTQILPYE